MWWIPLKLIGLGKPVRILLAVAQIALLAAAGIAAMMLLGFDPLGFVWDWFVSLIRSAIGV